MSQEQNGTKNRFDLEQEILSVWSSADDVKLIYDNVCQRYDQMKADDVANALLGIHSILVMKCETLFNTFEELVKNGSIGRN